MTRLKNFSVKTVSIILLLLTIFICIGGIAIFAYEASVNPVFADSDVPDDQSTLSFYSCASSFAQVTGYVTSPDFASAREDKQVEKSGIAKWKHVKQAAQIMQGVDAGTAGSFLGYYDAGDGNGFWGFFQTLASGTSTQYTYKALYSFPNVADNKAFASYAVYGYGLSLMGFDSTGGSSLGIVRIAAGGLFFAAFIIAFIVDAIFKAVLFVLNLLNPFALFRSVTAFTGFANLSVAGQSGFGSRLIGMISNLYDALADLSLAVLLPVFIALCAFTLLVMQNTGKAKNQLRKIVIRILFLAIGIPLLAGMYDACLQRLGTVETTASSAVQITGSTFFDFNSWVYGNSNGKKPLQLANKLSFTYDTSRNEIDLPSSTYMYLQNYCWDQNVASGAMPYVAGAAYTMRGTPSGVGHAQAGTVTNPLSGSMNGFNECVSLLKRYMFSEKIAAGDYESYIKSGYGTSSASADFARCFAGLRRVRYGSYDPDKSYEENNKYGLFSNADSGDSTNDNKDANSTNTVFRAFTKDISGGAIPDSLKHLVKGDLNGSWSGTGSVKTVTFDKDKYLSHLAMYNYLNTYFESTSMSCYSPSNAASLLVMRQHYQVNLVGTGMISFMYWLNGCVMLWCIALMGLCYGIGIMMGNLKRGIKILIQVPFAALGAMKSIARVISWTIMMMIEIMVTLFLYSFITSLFAQIPTIISSPIMNVLEGNAPDHNIVVNSITLPGTSMAIGGYMLTIAVLLVSVIVEIVFTIMALRLRKQVVKAVDEEAARIIEQVVGVGPGAASELPSQPGPIGNLASNALAAGAMAHALDAGSNEGTSFEKSASEDSMDTARTVVGTGDGSEVQAQMGMSSYSGRDVDGAIEQNVQDVDEAEPDAVVGVGAGGGSSVNISNADGDEVAQQTAREVIQAGSLGAASAGTRNVTQEGDTITDSNDTTDRHTENFETNIEESSESASNPVAVNDFDVARVGAGDEVTAKSDDEPDRGTYSTPVNIDDADVARIASSRDAKAGMPVTGRPGEGGKGGDGKKGEDGKDASDFESASENQKREAVAGEKVEPVREKTLRPTKDSPSIVPGVYAVQDKNGERKLVHSDGTPATKKESKAWDKEEKADSKTFDAAAKKEVRAANREDRVVARAGIKEDKADQRAEKDAGSVREQGKHMKQAVAAQERADVERNEAKKTSSEWKSMAHDVQAMTDEFFDDKQSEYTKDKQAARERADNRRAGLRNSVDAVRSDSRAKLASEREQSFEKRMHIMFPQAMDAEGNFHPEVLSKRDRARASVMQASHDAFMGAVRGKNTAVDASVNTVRKTRDSAVKTARSVKDTAVQTTLDVSKNITHNAVGAGSNAAGYVSAAKHIHVANKTQKEAVKEARRSRMYVPGVNYGDKQNGSSQSYPDVVRSGSRAEQSRDARGNASGGTVVTRSQTVERTTSGRFGNRQSSTQQRARQETVVSQRMHTGANVGNGSGSFGGDQMTERVERIYTERERSSGNGHSDMSRSRDTYGMKPRTMPTYSGGNREVDCKHPTPKQQAMKQFAMAAILSRMGNTGSAVASGLQTAAMINMMGGVNPEGGGMNGRQTAATVMAMRMAGQQAQQSAERRHMDDRRLDDAVRRVLNQHPDGQ